MVTPCAPAVDAIGPCPHTDSVMAARRRPFRVLLYALLAAILYLPALGRSALWEPDEGRYAEIAREMVLTNDYVTPRDNWVRYFEKPPLVYWAESAMIKLLGPEELAIRLPAALASVAEVTVTGVLAETMFGPAVGLAAALVLASCPLVFGFARFATLDPPLAFFMTAALAAFWASARAPTFDSKAGRRWFVLAGALIALGTLTKGLVAPVLTGAIALAWILTERRAKEIVRMPWLKCIALYAAITVPWFVLVALRNPGFAHFFFIHEHIDRYLDSHEHGWGPYFFVVVTAGGMWPWICFVPLGIRELLRGDRAKTEAAARERPDARSSLRFLLLWFSIILVFFSIPRSKLGSYILPGIPPLAIIAGYALVSLPKLGPKPIRSLLGTIALVNVVAAIAIAVVLPRFVAHLGPALVFDGIAASVAVSAGALICLAIAWRGRNVVRAAGALVLGVVVALGFLSKARMDAQPLGSYRELARAAMPYLGPTCRLASYRHFVQSIPFYTGHREALVDYRGELGPFGNSPGARASFIATDGLLARMWHDSACAVLIVNRKDLPHIRTLLGPNATVVGCEGKKLALYNHSVAVPPHARGCEADPDVSGTWFPVVRTVSFIW